MKKERETANKYRQQALEGDLMAMTWVYAMRKGLRWIHRATAQGFEHAKQWCRDNSYSVY